MRASTVILFVACLALSQAGLVEEMIQQHGFLGDSSKLDETFNTTDLRVIKEYMESVNEFGGKKLERVDEENQTAHTIVYPTNIEDGFSSEESYKAAFERLRAGSLDTLAAEQTNFVCETEYGPDYFRMAPQFKGAPLIGGAAVEFETPCFKSNTVTLAQKDDSTVVLTFKTSGKKSVLCYDWYLISNIQHFHVESVFMSKSHTVEFKDLNASDMADIKAFGIRLFRFCDGYKNALIDVIQTAKMFLGGITDKPYLPGPFGSAPTGYMTENNKKFLKEAIKWDMEERETEDVDIPKEAIKSGDMLAIFRLDGLDEIIMWGTGSHSGHTAMCMWIDDELHVFESQDGWYWPKHGIQMNPWDTWVKNARAAGFHVAVLPLSDEASKNFDVDKAYKWFKNGIEGLPYGYHNFLFSWIDLTGDANMPPILSLDFLSPAFAVVEKISPATTSSFLGEALNKRLGTTGLKMAELSAEAAKQGKTMNDLYAMVEVEGWEYSDGMSYVCSCFVTAMWKQGGVFGDLKLNATEFSPKDVYQLKIFDDKFQKPDVCAKADPSLPYCQIMGKYRLTLPNYNSIVPYSHMNEACPSKAPEFIRTPGC